MYKNPKYIYGPSTYHLVPANLHFGEFMLSKLMTNCNKIAAINGATNEELSYDEIAQGAMNVAVSLTRMGVRKGDVVAVSSETRREFLSTVIGVCCTGAVLTIIDIGYKNDELNHVLLISKPKYLFCSPFVYKTFGDIYKNLKHVTKIFLFDNESQPMTILYNDIAVAGSSNVGGITSNVTYEEFKPVEVEGENDLSFIFYSSGTTGLPKGVMVTHLTMLTVCSPNVKTHCTISLNVKPWYLTMGLLPILTSLTLGVTNVYLPEFEVESYLKAIEKYKVQCLIAVPYTLIAFCKSNAAYNTSSLQMIYSGTSPLYEETARAAWKKFPSVTAILQGYGMTETVLAVTINDRPDKIGSVGRVISHTVIKIINPESGEVLGPYKEGEIYVKSVLLMKGYIGRDRKEDIDEEGFFRTGDLGYYDHDRYIYIVDRLKEMIKYEGFQVSPAEIEAVLLKHPKIRDAGVIGIPHPAEDLTTKSIERQHWPLAFVVLQPGETLNSSEVENFIAERLSNSKNLRGGVRFIDEIPRNSAGKILRKELRKMIHSGNSEL